MSYAIFGATDTDKESTAGGVVTAEEFCKSVGFEWNPATMTCSQPAAKPGMPDPTAIAQAMCKAAGLTWDPTKMMCVQAPAPLPGPGPTPTPEPTPAPAPAAPVTYAGLTAGSWAAVAVVAVGLIAILGRGR